MVFNTAVENPSGSGHNGFVADLAMSRELCLVVVHMFCHPYAEHLHSISLYVRLFPGAFSIEKREDGVRKIVYSIARVLTFAAVTLLEQVLPQLLLHISGSARKASALPIGMFSMQPFKSSVALITRALFGCF